TAADLPTQYELRLRSGPVELLWESDKIVIGSFRKGWPVMPMPTVGPQWFRKMDRNADGDVSRREFLGSDQKFRQMDTDGDGLISLGEAERYDALKRDQR